MWLILLLTYLLHTSIQDGPDTTPSRANATYDMKASATTDGPTPIYKRRG